MWWRIQEDYCKYVRIPHPINSSEQRTCERRKMFNKGTSRMNRSTSTNAWKNDGTKARTNERTNDRPTKPRTKERKSYRYRLMKGPNNEREWATAPSTKEERNRRITLRPTDATTNKNKPRETKASDLQNSNRSVIKSLRLIAKQEYISSLAGRNQSTTSRRNCTDPWFSVVVLLRKCVNISKGGTRKRKPEIPNEFYEIVTNKFCNAY